MIFFRADVANAVQFTNPAAFHGSLTQVLMTQVLTSGKRLHNYGKSPFFMGKLTINSHFPVRFLYVYQVYQAGYLHKSPIPLDHHGLRTVPSPAT